MIGWDNALAESIFVAIERELIESRAWPIRARLRAAVFDCVVSWYNTPRLHSSLEFKSPADYEAAIHHAANPQAA